MSTFVKSAFLAVTITCACAALSAEAQTSQDANGMGRDPIVQEVKTLLENCEVRIIARSEAEYGKRYAELKSAHDRFISYMTIVVTAVGIIVGFFGAIVPICASYQTRSTVRQSKIDSDRMQRIVEKMEGRATELERIVFSSKAEHYFQLAKHSFEQYKFQKRVSVLENVVIDLIHSIAENVAAKDAIGLKRSISFLNIVLNKPVADDPELNLPKELESHRRIIEQNLRKYCWGFTMLDVRRVFEQGGVDEVQVGYSITNLEKIMGRFGI